jgi:hypothetical protein
MGKIKIEGVEYEVPEINFQLEEAVWIEDKNEVIENIRAKEEKFDPKKKITKEDINLDPMKLFMGYAQTKCFKYSAWFSLGGK